jgi:hypothetical protein
MGGVILINSGAVLSEEIIYFLLLNVIAIFTITILPRSYFGDIKLLFINNYNRKKSLIFFSNIFSLISITGAFYAFYEIIKFDEFGIILLEGSEEIRLDRRINTLTNIAQSLYIIALPLTFILNKITANRVLIFSLILFSLATGSRGPILYLLFILFLRSSNLNSIIIGFVSLIFFLGKALVFDVDLITYASDAFGSQIKMLNEYMLYFSNERFYGYFTFYRPFAALFENDPLSLIDLQKNYLQYTYKGLLVATGYVHSFLDFGFLGVVTFFFLNMAIMIFLIYFSKKLPLTTIVMLFAFMMMIYDNLFVQLFYIISIIFSLMIDIIYFKNNSILDNLKYNIKK